MRIDTSPTPPRGSAEALTRHRAWIGEREHARQMALLRVRAAPNPAERRGADRRQAERRQA
ncbi:hypothetical protein [Falsiroseomonas sp. CW058]|uniref:hypothetical protein n=1 Tax=Falsiroseomonas sp. CW058 TaxID=3388664 RepID=UPI003D316493